MSQRCDVNSQSVSWAYFLPNVVKFTGLKYEGEDIYPARFSVLQLVDTIAEVDLLNSRNLHVNRHEIYGTELAWKVCDGTVLANCVQFVAIRTLPRGLL